MKVSRFKSFNSCPREGAISPQFLLWTNRWLFQLMPPRGGNPRIIYFKINNLLMFQLMPPRGGNLFDPALAEDNPCVSTHAPARGQSIFSSFLKNEYSVSTHAPARGQSRLRPVSENAFSCFNSCPREGAISKSAQSSNDNATMFGQNRQLFAGFADNLFRAPLKTAPKMLFFCADPTGFCV